MGDRERILAWFGAALKAVDPERLTAEHLKGRAGFHYVIAVGKAGPAMCRGAHEALGSIEGICVTNRDAEVPEGIQLLIGDHPVPGAASFEAGSRLIELAKRMEGRCLALVSGGGSSLCEHPHVGVPAEFIVEVYSRLVRSGLGIQEMNMVRSHLSAIKQGGLAVHIDGEIETLVLSDVPGHGPEVVASGPTISRPADPEQALILLKRIGIRVPSSVARAVRSRDSPGRGTGPVTVIADGRMAAGAMAVAAGQSGAEARVYGDWLRGPVDSCLDALFDDPHGGLTVATGEPEVTVGGNTGRGGRNSHAALLAATRIAGGDWSFAALATDGVDGGSAAAGAIVDGGTVGRGGDPSEAIGRFDSTAYLERSRDLVVTGPTETNVADLWGLYRPRAGPANLY